MRVSSPLGSVIAKWQIAAICPRHPLPNTGQVLGFRYRWARAEVRCRAEEEDAERGRAEDSERRARARSEERLAQVPNANAQRSAGIALFNSSKHVGSAFAALAFGPSPPPPSPLWPVALFFCQFRPRRPSELLARTAFPPVAILRPQDKRHSKSTQETSSVEVAVAGRRLYTGHVDVPDAPLVALVGMGMG
jgi:hypothetical protein